MTYFLKVNAFNSKGNKELRRKLRNEATEFEVILWSRLRQRQCGNYKFIRQFGIGPYILDFYCPARRLGVELDGSQHAEPEQQLYDEERTAYLKHLNIKVIRFWNNEVNANLEGVLERILEDLLSVDSLPKKKRIRE